MRFCPHGEERGNAARLDHEAVSDLLAALAHLGAEFTVDGFGEILRPAVHVGHAELNGAGLARQQLLAERRLVEGDEVLQFLLGKLVGVDVRHAVADFLFAAGKLLRDDHGDFVEILLVVQVGAQQRILGLLHDIGNGARVHRAGVLHCQNFLGGGDRRRRALLERRGSMVRAPAASAARRPERLIAPVPRRGPDAQG